MIDRGAEDSPEKRIILVASRFSSDDREKLVKDKSLRRFVRGFKLSKKMLTLGEFHVADEVKGLVCEYGLDLMADIQLAGGYEDIVEEYERVMRLYHPNIVTLAAGTTREAFQNLKDATPDNCDVPKIFITAALPEVNPVTFKGDFLREPRDYTQWRGDVAVGVVDGVYGAAIHADVHDWHSQGLLYLGAGISMDGRPYMDREGKVEKVALTAGGAIIRGCDLILVGDAIARAPSPTLALGAMGEGMDLALAA